MRDEYKDTHTTDTGTDRPLSTADMAGQPADRTETGGTESVMRSTGASGTGRMSPLMNSEETQSFRSRWSSIQADFVDEPRHSVEQADTLVAEVMQQLAKTFATEKDKLEGQWSRGQDVSTEDLRIALQRYRSFFDRLLTL